MQNNSGQAVLIVLLSMVVSLTAVLSIVASSTSDIRIGSTESTSQRAFSAAEAGIEKALITNLAIAGDVESGASYNVAVSGLAEGERNFIFPLSLFSGDEATFWFVSHTDSGLLTCGAGEPCFSGKDLKICWGAPGSASGEDTTAALELSLFYLATPGNYATAQTMKAIFDPNAGRTGSNYYESTDPGSCTIGGTSFAFQKRIDLNSLAVPASSYGNSNGLQFLSARLLYNATKEEPIGLDVDFAGNTTLPSQGYQVSSTGNVNEISRKIEVVRAYSGIPPVFNSAIFSPGGLSK